MSQLLINFNIVLAKTRSKFSFQFSGRFEFSCFSTINHSKRNAEQFAEFGLCEYQFIAQFLDCLRISRTMLTYLLDYDMNITFFTLSFNEERRNVPLLKVIVFLNE